MMYNIFNKASSPNRIGFAQKDENGQIHAYFDDLLVVGSFVLEPIPDERRAGNTTGAPFNPAG